MQTTSHLLSILIPTLKNKEEIEILKEEIIKSISFKTEEYSIFASCSNNSASINRNICLNTAKSKYIIMLDDDIKGFYKGWEIELLKPLIEDDNILVVAPRLLHTDKSYALMMGDPFQYKGIVNTLNNRVCTACIAFRKEDVNGLSYDENFIGSGFEDDDFMIQLNLKHSDKKIVINNNVKLTHKNEMKNQKNKYWEHNKTYFLKKYPEELDRWHN